MDTEHPDIAVWVVTPNGLKLARRLKDRWPRTTIMCSQSISGQPEGSAEHTFSRLSEAVAAWFSRFEGHVFIMATGIVVRMIAPHLRQKTRDPAVVAMDDCGRFAISLVSGHIGGANALARAVANILGAVPVITTATDVNQVPAIDEIAKKNHLFIENPAAIKAVNMAILKNETFLLYDPYRFAGAELDHYAVTVSSPASPADDSEISKRLSDGGAGVFIDDAVVYLPATVLVLRPASLAVGIGCNRHTSAKEIKDLLDRVLKENRLSPASLNCIASVDLKADEAGLVELARDLELAFLLYSREELGEVNDIPNPSARVQKCIGVKSVCEAAALLASRKGKLIVPKQTSRNVTVAVARIPCTSSASDPAARSTCPGAPLAS
ncbi:MAG: cobalt-precorrin 5A hydrolase [Deltaproteobacteria bacterium]|nr:cobalt-precorrin 5A hydrolase [Deltaproteobacteria bacterium]